MTSEKSDQPKPGTTPALSEKLWKSGQQLSSVNGLAQLGALLLIFLFFSVAEWLVIGTTSFASFYNVTSIASQFSIVATAALGMTFIIIAGGIDLSAGTALALCATVCARLLKEDQSAMLAVPATIMTGIACGAFNGVLISFLRVVPFIITLGTMSLYLGLAKLVAENSTVSPDKKTQIPDWLEFFTSNSSKTVYMGLPLGTWMLLILALLTYLFLRYSVFSRYIFALGSNESTARLCGINIPWTKIALYALAGIFVGMAGLYQFSRLSGGSPGSGTGLELKIIAAVVIGGGSLSGGRGTVQGTLIGAYIIFMIESGCTKIGLSNETSDITLGIIVIAAVAIDQWRQHRLARI